MISNLHQWREHGTTKLLQIKQDFKLNKSEILRWFHCTAAHIYTLSTHYVVATYHGKCRGATCFQNLTNVKQQLKQSAAAGCASPQVSSELCCCPSRNEPVASMRPMLGEHKIPHLTLVVHMCTFEQSQVFSKNTRLSVLTHKLKLRNRDGSWPGVQYTAQMKSGAMLMFL